MSHSIRAQSNRRTRAKKKRKENNIRRSQGYEVGVSVIDYVRYMATKLADRDRSKRDMESKERVDEPLPPIERPVPDVPPIILPQKVMSSQKIVRSAD